jgi:hypothetical protein
MDNQLIGVSVITSLFIIIFVYCYCSRRVEQREQIEQIENDWN